MSISRLLDQPYIDIKDLGDLKPWTLNHRHPNMNPRALIHIIWTLNSRLDSFFTEVTSFQTQSGWIDSDQAFIDFCQNNISLIEIILLEKVFKKKVLSQVLSEKQREVYLSFEALSVMERINRLGLVQYRQDRNLVALWHLSK